MQFSLKIHLRATFQNCRRRHALLPAALARISVIIVKSLVHPLTRGIVAEREGTVADRVRPYDRVELTVPLTSTRPILAYQVTNDFDKIYANYCANLHSVTLDKR
jgi:hypothetical protein